MMADVSTSSTSSTCGDEDETVEKPFVTSTTAANNEDEEEADEEQNGNDSDVVGSSFSSKKSRDGLLAGSGPDPAFTRQASFTGIGASSSSSQLTSVLAQASATGGMATIKGVESAATLNKKTPFRIDLSRDDLIKLLSYLEGELQARDVAIAALHGEKAKQLLYQAKYGRLGLNDPLAALQRDSDDLGACTTDDFDEKEIGRMYESQLAQLEKLIAVQRKAHHRAKQVLSSAERRHARTVKELEEERRRTMADAAQGDDVCALLEKEREKLKHELEYEKSEAVRQADELERSRRAMDEEKDRHKAMVLYLVNERRQLLLRLHELRHKRPTTDETDVAQNSSKSTNEDVIALKRAVKELRKEMDQVTKDRNNIKKHLDIERQETASLREIVRTQEEDLKLIRDNILAKTKQGSSGQITGTGARNSPTSSGVLPSPSSPTKLPSATSGGSRSATSNSGRTHALTTSYAPLPHTSGRTNAGGGTAGSGTIISKHLPPASSSQRMSSGSVGRPPQPLPPSTQHRSTLPPFSNVAVSGRVYETNIDAPSDGSSGHPSSSRTRMSNNSGGVVYTNPSAAMHSVEVRGTAMLPPPPLGPRPTPSPPGGSQRPVNFTQSIVAPPPPPQYASPTTGREPHSSSPYTVGQSPQQSADNRRGAAPPPGRPPVPSPSSVRSNTKLDGIQPSGPSSSAAGRKRQPYNVMEGSVSEGDLSTALGFVAPTAIEPEIAQLEAAIYSLATVVRETQSQPPPSPSLSGVALPPPSLPRKLSQDSSSSAMNDAPTLLLEHGHARVEGVARRNKGFPIVSPSDSASSNGSSSLKRRSSSLPRHTAAIPSLSSSVQRQQSNDSNRNTPQAVIIHNGNTVVTKGALLLKRRSPTSQGGFRSKHAIGLKPSGSSVDYFLRKWKTGMETPSATNLISQQSRPF